MDVSVMFFASGEESSDPGRYDLVLDCARFADRNGLENVWIPERHFAPLGCLYPNPAVLCAALARETERIGLRAGSVVLPLHHPARIVEEWSMVDNLSNGRVGLSFAPGWGPADFAYFPERYAERHRHLVEGLDTVRQLWSGGRVMMPTGTGGELEQRVYPTPVTPELPVWITAASSEQSFRTAGEQGAHLLTHLLDTDVDGIADRIRIYRQARAAAGHDPATGRVSLMVHTFLGRDHESTLEAVREPFCNFLKSNSRLLAGLAASRGRDVDLSILSERDLDELVNFLFERFATTRAFLGSTEHAAELAERLCAAGVDELACLLDFGPSNASIREHLPHLAEFRAACEGFSRTEGADAVSLPVPEPVLEPVVAGPQLGEDLELVRERCTTELSGEEFYALAARLGAVLGESFHGIERVFVGEGEALAQLSMPAGLPGEGESLLSERAIAVHCSLMLPGLLAPPELLERAGTFLLLPTGKRSYEVKGRPGRRAWAHLVRGDDGGHADRLVGDVLISSETGEPLIDVRGMSYQVFELEEKRDSGQEHDAAASSLAAELAPLPASEREARVLELLVNELAGVLRAEPSVLDRRHRLGDLGLDSLMAIELRGRIESLIGHCVSVVRFLEGPTLAELATEIAEGLSSERPRHALVPLRSGGDATPLVLVHPIGGGLEAMSRLAEHLDGRRPVFGLEHPGLVSGGALPEGFDELVDRHLAALREHFPSGSVHLGGWSLGGVLAQEMARRLDGEDLVVESLLLIDTHAAAEDNLHLFPGLREPALGPDPSPEATERLALDAFCALQWGAPGEGETLSDRAWNRGLEPAPFERPFAVFLSGFRARAEHRPATWRGPVALLVAAEQPPGLQPAADLGWTALSGSLRRRAVPGRHFTLFDEAHLTELAAAVDGSLQDLIGATETAALRRQSA